MSDMHDDYESRVLGNEAPFKLPRAWRDLSVWLDQRERQVREHAAECASYGTELTEADRALLKRAGIRP